MLANRRKQCHETYDESNIHPPAMRVCSKISAFPTKIAYLIMITEVKRKQWIFLKMRFIDQAIAAKLIPTMAPARRQIPPAVTPAFAKKGPAKMPIVEKCTMAAIFGLMFGVFLLLLPDCIGVIR